MNIKEFKELITNCPSCGNKLLFEVIGSNNNESPYEVYDGFGNDIITDVFYLYDNGDFQPKTNKILDTYVHLYCYYKCYKIISKSLGLKLFHTTYNIEIDLEAIRISDAIEIISNISYNKSK